MAWVKIPKEHHPIFFELVPDDDRIETKVMFGGVCAMTNGYMMGGLFAHSIIVRLGEADYARAIAEGAEPFDPMGKNAPMADTVLLTEAHFADRKGARTWLAKAFEFTSSLPPKRAAKRAKAAPRKAAPKKAAPKKAAKNAVAATEKVGAKAATKSPARPAPKSTAKPPRKAKTARKAKKAR